MATSAGTYSGDCLCLNLQVSIDAIQAEKNYAKSAKGLTEILVSNENKGVFAQYMTDSKGALPDPAKKGRVYVDYYPQLCSFSSASAVDRCSLPTSGTAHVGKSLDEHKADLRTTFSVEINRDDFRDKCYGAEDAKRDLFVARKDVVMKDIENKLIAALSAQIGGYKNQTSPVTSLTNPLTVNVLNTAGQLNTSAFGIMKQQFKKKKVDAPIHYLAGTGSLFEMGVDSIPYGVANTTTGTDVNKISGKYHISEDLNSDTTLAAATGASKIIAIPEGTYQLITWNANVGKYEELFAQSGYRWEKSTVDMWGFTWDVYIQRTVCSDIYTFELNYGLIKWIADAAVCSDRSALSFVEGCGVEDCSTLADAVSA